MQMHNPTQPAPLRQHIKTPSFSPIPSQIPVHPNLDSSPTAAIQHSQNQLGTQCQLPSPRSNSLHPTEPLPTFENITCEYEILRNKVEERIRVLEDRCQLGDPDQRCTRISFGSSPDTFLQPCVNKASNNCHFSNTRAYNPHDISQPTVRKRQYSSQSSKVHPHTRPHILSIDDRVVPLCPAWQEKSNDIKQCNQENYYVRESHHRRCDSGHESLSSHELSSLNRTLLENLKSQKQLNQSIKTLNERIYSLNLRKSQMEFDESFNKNRNANRNPQDKQQQKKRFKEQATNSENTISGQAFQSSGTIENQISIQKFPKFFSTQPKPQTTKKPTPTPATQKQKKLTSSKSKKPSKPQKQKKRDSYTSDHSSRSSSNNSSQLSTRSQQSQSSKLFSFRVVPSSSVVICDAKKSVKNSSGSEYFQVNRQSDVDGNQGKVEQAVMREYDLHLQVQEKDRNGMKKRKNKNGKIYNFHDYQELLRTYEEKPKINKNQVYVDSKLGNKKHERQHLLQSFEQHTKLRRQVVGKMNSYFNKQQQSPK